MLYNLIKTLNYQRTLFATRKSSPTTRKANEAYPIHSSQENNFQVVLNAFPCPQHTPLCLAGSKFTNRIVTSAMLFWQTCHVFATFYQFYLQNIHTRTPTSKPSCIRLVLMAVSGAMASEDAIGPTDWAKHRKKVIVIGDTKRRSRVMTMESNVASKSTNWMEVAQLHGSSNVTANSQMCDWQYKAQDRTDL
jgi:hypothetical protein